MAAKRLRQRFLHPADDIDDDDIPKDMDEEEQEKLIQKLRAEDHERNEEYKRFFLAIPTVAAASYLPALIMSRLISAKLISILSISSLIATTYILVSVPNTRADKLNSKKSKQPLQPEQGRIHKYISYLNGSLSLLIAINASSFKNKRGVHEGFWLLCLLPVVSFSVIVLARRLMLSVDVDELEQLKYRYKGA